MKKDILDSAADRKAHNQIGLTTKKSNHYVTNAEKNNCRSNNANVPIVK